jgi:hypothetical protein
VPPMSADWDPWHEQLSDVSVLPEQFFTPQTNFFTGRPITALLQAVLEGVLSQTLHGDEQNYHFLLSTQPKHRIALPAFVTRSLQ